MMRLFVGIVLPEDIIRRLSPLCVRLRGARWVHPGAMHMTLRFIGEMDDAAAAADIDGALARIDSPAFDMSLAGLGTFGQGKKVRALWVGVEAQSELARLRGKVESAVVRAGQPLEGRRFTPHVTLARFKSADPSHLKAFIEGNNLFRAGPVAVESFTLFESRMGKGGSVYTPLADYTLV